MGWGSGVDPTTEERDDVAPYSPMNQLVLKGQLSPIMEEATVVSKASSTGWGPSSSARIPTLTLPPPPPARQAAFHGPPRFRWMDVVSEQTIEE
jgi:hypothetical protein